jgi:uncharacterized protein with HEPN domain
MSRHTDALYLDHIVAACDRIRRYMAGVSLADFLSNDEKQSAVIRQLEIVGEAVGQLSDAFRRAHPDLPWARVKALRNVLIHGYADVDLHQVWVITQENVPALGGAAARLLAALTEHDPEWDR